MQLLNTISQLITRPSKHYRSRNDRQTEQSQLPGLILDQHPFIRRNGLHRIKKECKGQIGD